MTLVRDGIAIALVAYILLLSYKISSIGETVPYSTQSHVGTADQKLHAVWAKCTENATSAEWYSDVPGSMLDGCSWSAGVCDAMLRPAVPQTLYHCSHLCFAAFIVCRPEIATQLNIFFEVTHMLNYDISALCFSASCAHMFFPLLLACTCTENGNFFAVSSR